MLSWRWLSDHFASKSFTKTTTCEEFLLVDRTLITSKEFELARDKHNEEMKSKRATRTKKRKVVEPDQASDSDQEQRIEPVVKLSARKTVPRKRK